MTPEEMDERDVVEFTDDAGNTLLLEVMDYFFYNGEEFAALCDAIGLAILGISYGLFKQLCRKGRTEETDAQKCENVHMGMREAVPLAIACAMLALLGVASFMVTLIDFSQFGVVQ